MPPPHGRNQRAGVPETYTGRKPFTQILPPGRYTQGTADSVPPPVLYSAKSNTSRTFATRVPGVNGFSRKGVPGASTPRCTIALAV